MDAFFKCLLATVMSLLPHSGPYSEHLISDKQLVTRFNTEQENFHDLLLDMMIANQPPNVVVRNSEDPSHINMENYTAINRRMGILGVRTIISDGTQFSFRMDETKDSTKDIVFFAYGFVDSVAGDSERITVSKIDNDWGIICTQKGQPQPQLKSIIRFDSLIGI